MDRSEHNNTLLQLFTRLVESMHYTKKELFRKETRPFLSTHFWFQSFCAHS